MSSLVPVAPVVVLSTCLWCSVALAQAQPDKSPPVDAPAQAIEPAPSEDSPVDWDLFVLPVVAYTPETSFIFGAAAAVALKDTSVENALQSSATADATYTLKNQWGVRLNGAVYLNRDKILLEADLGVFSWKDFYFGLGDDPLGKDEGRVFTYYEGRAEVALLHRIWLRTLYAGGIFRSNGIDITQSDSTELLALRGGQGGNTFGLGVQVVWDGRDRSFWTQRGTYAKVNAVKHLDAILSDFDLFESDLDLRGFIPLPGGVVLGAQTRVILRTGEVPYFRQAVIGGSTNLRGTFRGRFRQNIGGLAQAEIRSPYVFWRLALVGFGGIGVVAPDLGSWAASDPVYVAGGGLRLGVTDDGVNIRADYGFGPDGETGFYLALGEAF